jgi:hypothetical protein
MPYVTYTSSHELWSRTASPAQRLARWLSARATGSLLRLLVSPFVSPSTLSHLAGAVSVSVLIGLPVLLAGYCLCFQHAITASALLVGTIIGLGAQGGIGAAIGCLWGTLVALTVKGLTGELTSGPVRRVLPPLLAWVLTAWIAWSLGRVAARAYRRATQNRHRIAKAIRVTTLILVALAGSYFVYSVITGLVGWQERLPRSLQYGWTIVLRVAGHPVWPRSWPWLRFVIIGFLWLSALALTAIAWMDVTLLPSAPFENCLPPDMRRTRPDFVNRAGFWSVYFTWMTICILLTLRILRRLDTTTMAGVAFLAIPAAVVVHLVVRVFLLAKARARRRRRGNVSLVTSRLVEEIIRSGEGRPTAAAGLLHDTLANLSENELRELIETLEDDPRWTGRRRH